MTVPSLPEPRPDPRPDPRPAAQPNLPAPMPAGPPAGPVLVSIGDITVEQHRIVTPAGVLPARGANWTAMDLSRQEERMPAYAIVLTIVFFLFCLLGLLFLLVKERRTVGHVQVTVNSAGRMHSTMIPVSSQNQVADILARVNYARGLSF